MSHANTLGECQGLLFTPTLKEFHPIKHLTNDKNVILALNTRHLLFISLGTVSFNFNFQAELQSPGGFFLCLLSTFGSHSLGLLWPDLPACVL